MPTTIRTDEPRELLALVPYQLGFVPQESAVLIGLRPPRSRVGLVARVDLCDLLDEASGDRLADALVGHLCADGSNRAVLVLYTAEDLQGDPSAGVAALGVLRDAAAGPGGVAVGDAWVVGPTGYYGLGCLDGDCCPPGGHPLVDLQSTRIGAQMVLSGATVAPHRADLGAVPDAGPTARRSARRAAQRYRTRWEALDSPGDLHRWRRAGLDLWRAELERTARACAVPGGPVEPPDPNRLGRLQVALADVLVRDAVMIGFVPGSSRLADRVVAGYGGPEIDAALRAIIDPVDGVAPDLELVDACTRVLGEVVSHSASSARAPATTLLAVLAWWQGDGALAGVLVERALAADPTYRLALLVDQTLAAGMPPGWLRSAGTSARAIG